MTELNPAQELPERASAGAGVLPVQTTPAGPINVAAAQCNPVGNSPANGEMTSSALAAAPDTHDFRDRGDPMVKVHPDPQHWSNWEWRPDLRNDL